MKKDFYFNVMKTEVLGIQAYRGSGKLSSISKISKADVFDELKNPKGTQRGLKIKHAKDAYNYVQNNSFGFWPEVVLSCRNPSVIDFEIVNKEFNAGHLYIDVPTIEKIHKRNKIAISRVDGNHRLYYADGSMEDYPQIEKIASFCLLINLTIEQEIQLFRDINNNLERMPTSHLDYITVRLTDDEILKRSDPNLYIAERLDEDDKSPFFERISKTGKKGNDRDIPLRALKSGIGYLRSNTKDLQTMSASDPDVEYEVIKNYFIALKKWQPDAWENPTEYLLLRGSGFWGACYLGGEVIDLCLSDGKYEIKDMLEILQSGKDWDWSNKGDFQGFGGGSGAKKISNTIKSYLPTKAGISMLSIREKIVSKSNK